MYRKLLGITFLFSAFFFATSCSREHQVHHNLVFMIVDGMGPAHITGARIFKNDSSTPLEIERMPYLAMARTHSSSNFVTDSAASATSLASGYKTYNGAIGLSDPRIDETETSRPLKSILTAGMEKEYLTAVVTNTRITHATPAAFYAHVAHRSMENEIAYQLLSSEIDLIIGGGLKHFIPEQRGGARDDGLDLIKKFEQRGYLVILDPKEFRRFDFKKLESGQKILAILNDDHIEYEDLQKEDEVTLLEITDFSLQYLRTRQEHDGRDFMMIIESGRVDHASHRNEARRTFVEMVAMDNSMARILQEVEDTLVVLTADHETGGLALNGYAPLEAVSGEGIFKNHQADYRDGTRYGLISWGSGPGYQSNIVVNEEEKNFRHKAVYPVRFAHHSAVDVPVLAKGPGAKIFRGYIDNTDIPKKIDRVLNLALFD